MNASDIAAWWGAIVATAVLGWDIFKWKRTGVQLRVTVSGGMATYGDVPDADPEQLYVVIQVVNVGDKTTEVTHVVALFYKTRWQKVRRKPDKAFLVLHPSFGQPFPHNLEPGKRWMGGLKQTDDLVALSREGYLYCGIHHTAGSKAIVERLVIKEIYGRIVQPQAVVC